MTSTCRSTCRSILLLALALAGCAGAKVNTQYDPNAPFKSYKTYAWLATQPGAEQAAAVRDPGARQLIVNAVDREMAKKGFTRTTPDANPDLLVSVIGWAQQRVEVTNYGTRTAAPTCTVRTAPGTRRPSRR
jgi:hypothetical protein